VKIAIVHYHWNRGGVTRVVESTLLALEKEGHDIGLFSSSGEFPLQGKSQIKTVALPELSYRDDGDPEEGKALAGKLVVKAQELWGSAPDIWHIHNHGLGKNPVLSHAIPFLAEMGQRLLLHIHDFAEDMRAGNYALLKSTGALRYLYPEYPLIHYAVLNGRDFRILLEAGLEKNSCHFLPNPVVPPPVPEEEVPIPENLILYPTRAIRRKNIGEFILLASLAQKTSWGTTLRPTNPREIPRYMQWRKLAAEMGLKVFWELGEKEDSSFPSLFHGAKGIVTTSIAEGFGLAFLEPLAAGKVLLGRNLPEITADFSHHGLAFDDLYKTIPVRLDELPPQAMPILLEQAANRARSFGTEAPTMSELAKALVKDHQIDFGVLPEDLQSHFICRMQGHHRQKESWLHRLLHGETWAPIEKETQRIAMERFSVQAYGERLQMIYQHLTGIPAPRQPISYLPHGEVLKGFLNWERFSCLR